MSLFGSKKKDGDKEFEEMRRALGVTDRSRQNDPISQEASDSASRGDRPAVIGPSSEHSRGSDSISQSDRPAATTPAPDAAPPNQPAKAVPTAPENCSSVVAVGSNWQGSFKLNGSIRVDGHLSGEIEAQDTVHVAESAQVDAKVQATFVIIAGTFQGQVQCRERLELMPTSRITGELTTKSLMMHEGASIDGQIRMTTSGGTIVGRSAR